MSRRNSVTVTEHVTWRLWLKVEVIISQPVPVLDAELLISKVHELRGCLQNMLQRSLLTVGSFSKTMEHRSSGQAVDKGY